MSAMSATSGTARVGVYRAALGWVDAGSQTLAVRGGTYDAARPTAMFDFDSTLAPCRGRGPPAEATIRSLARLAEAFNIVIVSNRGTSGRTAALAPLEPYAAALNTAMPAGVRATVYASLARDRGRKPHTGAWDHFVAGPCGGARPWFAFYCGDAAGRPGDHAATDYMFALNIGVPFVVPEALFGPGGGGAVADPWADPASLGCAADAPAEIEGPPRPGEGDRTIALLGESVRVLRESRQPLAVILVGSPASGKSRLADALASVGFEVASRDRQGAASAQVFARAVAARRNVVVDGTHPAAADRAALAARARAGGLAVALCHVRTPKPVCFHLNAARCQLDASGRTAELPAVALHTYWKRLEAPTADEAAKYGGRLLAIPFVLSPDAPPEVARYRYPLGGPRGPP